MGRKVRIGIIGCGGIANGKHMPSLKKIDTVEMVAFCDIVRERAEKAAKEYGTPDARVYTDYKELLKLDLDVVHVLTPNKQHSFITVDALESGKHVMCEKPMAKCAADARRMVEAAKETGKKLTIGYQHRQKAESQYVKACIDRGMQMDIDDGIALENELFAMCFATADQKEGMSAFLEKRKEKHFQNK